MVIVARFVWVFPATYLPRLSKRVRDRDPSPPWQWPFRIPSPVRGAVSARRRAGAALALPNGEGFPTGTSFCLSVSALFNHHASGTWARAASVIRWLGSRKPGREEPFGGAASEITARRDALADALRSLDAMAEDRELSR